MADNTINIDLLINTANSAKSIKEQRTALRELRSALLQVEEGSEAFNRISQATGELNDKIADLRAQTAFYADDLRTLSGLTDIGEGIAAGFGLATSALEALGVGSETAQEAIKKLEIAQTALNSITAIGNLIQKESAANILLTNTLKRLGITLTVAEGVAVESLTVKQRILNLVQKASPMGILIGVVGALTAAYAFLTTKTDKQIEAEKQSEIQKKKLIAAEKARQEQIKETGDYIGKEASNYVLLTDQLSKTLPKSKERFELITKINSTYGTTLKNLSDEKAFQEQVNTSVKDYIEFLKSKYALQSNEKLIQDNLSKQYKLEKQLVEQRRESILVNARYEAKRQSLIGQDFDVSITAEGKAFDALNKSIAATETELEAANKRLQGYVNASTAISKKISDTGLKTESEAEKTNTKITKNAQKTYKTLLDLQQKYADELADAQNELNLKIVEDDEVKYNELLSNLESYNTEYLAAYNAEQDKILAAQKASLDQQETEEVNAAKKEIEAVLAQYKIGTEKYTEEKERGRLILENITKTYNTKEQVLINNNDKVKQDKEIEIQDKLRQIRQNAREKDIQELQGNLELAESNLINYNQRVSVLLRKTPVSYQFPESSNEVILKNLQGNLEDVRKIQDLLNDSTSVYNKELKEIYARQRENIKNAVVSEEKQLELGIKDITRAESEKKLVEANNIMAKEFFELVKKISQEKQLGLESTNADVAAIFKGVEFINKRKMLQEEYNKLVDAAASKESEKVKALEDYKKLHEEDLALVVESQKTEEEFYKLLVQQNVVSAIFNGTMGEIMANELKSVELNEKKSELLVGQQAIIRTENEDLTNFFKGQIESSEKINAILDERQKKLKVISLVTDDYEREAQTIQTFLSTSQQISKILVEDGKKFEEFGRSFYENLFDVDFVSTKYEKSLLQLSATLTTYINLEKQRFENIKKGIKENTTLSKAEQDKQIEEEEKKHQEKLNEITQSGELQRIQIEENTDKERQQRRKENIEEITKFIGNSFDLIVDFAQRASDARVALIEREKEAALEQFDLDMKYQEMVRNEAEIKDFQEAVRQQEIADKRLALEEEYNAKIREEKRRAFNAQKAADVIQAGINTALAVTRVLYNPILAALVGIAGAAQATFIATQPAPEFALGGVLDGPSHDNGGIKTPFGELEGGEAVINKKSTKMFKPLLSKINEAGGGIAFADGGTLPMQPISDTYNSNRDLQEIKGILNSFASKPILTYVNESDVTRAQKNQQKINKRTSF